MNIMTPNDLDDLTRSTQHRQLLQITPHRLRLRIHKPQHPNPELRMLHKLPTNQLTNLTRTHDNRVLRIRRMMTHHEPSHRATAGHER